ncbi:DUF6706 family protein [Alloprevotella tannerae]|uniref:Uncharacterized protein n=1 Tax=Alloprevotella tannerae TaxID=76122 RepID=A0A929RX99_9BACT|nr:DUF6706 family protein [Alloprevotella tannerae]MBF0969517.1 hypothetical protein [Alloprevotella tannerae]
MATITKFDALIGELEPYTSSPASMTKSLLDAGVQDPEEEYTAEDKRTVAKAAIAILKKLIVLSSDSLGKSSQGYNVDKLEKRIKLLAKENDLEVSDFVGVPTVEDGSILW